MERKTKRDLILTNGTFRETERSISKIISVTILRWFGCYECSNDKILAKCCGKKAEFGQLLDIVVLYFVYNFW